jgi:hypothetical protein
MDLLWERDLYKPLNMANIQGYPNKIPMDVNKWLPIFLGNNVIIIEDHIYVMGPDMDNSGIDHEDVAMKLFASSLTEEALDWFKGLPDNQIVTYDAFLAYLKENGQENQMVGHLQLGSIK